MMVYRIVWATVTFYIIQFYDLKVTYVTTNAAVSAFSTSLRRNSRRRTDSMVRRDEYRYLPVQLHRGKPKFKCRSITCSKTRLCMSGIGIATNYTWKEDAYEIELSVQVPKTTRTKDIRYKATSRSIDLRFLPVSTSSYDSGDSEIVLLDGSRKLRGRINVDGTYWVISDVPNAPSATRNDDDAEGVPDESEPYRQITVTIEKIIATPKDDFDIIDYDWKGIYHSEEENEISVRTYDAPEPFNVRQYAAEMGVDIDNLNMSMVDKTMFTSKLNITKSTLQTLHKAGYISPQEITQQRDGTEYIVNPETGEPQLLNENTDKVQASAVKIPFIDDTAASWNDETKPDVATPEPIATTAGSGVRTPTIPDGNRNSDEVVQLKRNFTRAAFVADQMNPDNGTSNNNPFRSSSSPTTNNKNNDDPIDALTVVRLKEILKSQGLKTSGTKSELQQRLRQKVNALLQQQSLGE